MSLRCRTSAYSLFPLCAPSTNTSSSTVDVIPIWYDPSIPAGKIVDILGQPEFEKPDFFPTEGKEEHNQSSENRPNGCSVLRLLNKIKKRTANMKQLIPLRLPTMSCPFSKVPAPVKNISNPIVVSERQVISPARRISVRRSRPGPVTDLNLLPYTREEWRRIMEEVKALYSRGQYKQCSTRCKQVLNGIKDPYRVHPLYSVYLAFFAASSLEITASSLPHSSSAKLHLYHEALAYYQKAEDGLEYASFTTDSSVLASMSRPAQISKRVSSLNQDVMADISTSSISSANSLLSSGSSVFSHRSSSSCSNASANFVFTSPFELDNSSNAHLTARCSSLPGNLHPIQPLRYRKKVSFAAFSPTLETLMSETDVPATVNESSTILNAFPSPPCSPALPDSPTLPSSSPTIQDASESHVKYKMHLSDLALQLAYHISVLHQSIANLSSVRAPRKAGGSDFSVELLFKDVEAPSRPSSSSALSREGSRRSDRTVRTATSPSVGSERPWSRMSERPGSRMSDATMRPATSPGLSRPRSRMSEVSERSWSMMDERGVRGLAMGIEMKEAEKSEECQIADIQQRITKLRANGWQRKRFDPSRYRDLCERALYEVVEGDHY